MPTDIAVGSDRCRIGWSGLIYLMRRKTPPFEGGDKARRLLQSWAVASASVLGFGQALLGDRGGCVGPQKHVAGEAAAYEAGSLGL